MLDERAVYFTAVILQYAADNPDSGRLQFFQTATPDLWVGIRHSGYHPSDTGPDQGLAARRGFAGMTARLEGYVHIGSLRQVSRHFQGVDLGMGTAGLLMPSRTDDLAVPDDNASHRRVGRGCADPFAGQGQGLFHIFDVVGHLFKSS